jgi:SAM-dependent methyltransferase
MAKERVADPQRSEEDHVRAILSAMSGANRFNRWMAGCVTPYLGENVLEAGAGTGNLTRLLCQGRNYVATDINPHYLADLRTRLSSEPKLATAICDVTNAADLAPFRKSMDTVVCLNVLEHIDDEIGALRNLYSALKTGGCAIVLVPQGANLFGTLDDAVDHHRRYSKPELLDKMRSAGFTVERILPFNRAGSPGWFFNGRVLGRRHLGSLQLKLFDWLVPLWKRIDAFLPFPPTSLIAIGRRE